MSTVAEPSTRSANARRFSDEFKRDAVRLITEERYTFKAAAAAVGVSEKSLRAERHERIQQAVRQAHAESHGIYGSHKIAEVLAQRDDHRHHLPADGYGLGVPGGGDRFVQSQGGGLVARARRWLRSWRAWRCVGPSSRVALKAAGSCTIPIAAVSTPATPISKRCAPWASSVP